MQPERFGHEADPCSELKAVEAKGNLTSELPRRSKAKQDIKAFPVQSQSGEYRGTTIDLSKDKEGEESVAPTRASPIYTGPGSGGTHLSNEITRFRLIRCTVFESNQVKSLARRYARLPKITKRGPSVEYIHEVDRGELEEASIDRSDRRARPGVKGPWKNAQVNVTWVGESGTGQVHRRRAWRGEHRVYRGNNDDTPPPPPCPQLVAKYPKWPPPGESRMRNGDTNTVVSWCVGGK
ncbi:hypothetical protein KM043_014102 [Ampulex compressa]|nr:hypothetical protein KM043_014102 [Ampulex compressa]